MADPFNDAADAADMTESLSREIWPLIAPKLVGKPVEVQGAVLGDLVAKWLAGQFVNGGTAKDHAKWRRQMLADFAELVADLIPFNDPTAGL